MSQITKQILKKLLKISINGILTEKVVLSINLFGIKFKHNVYKPLFYKPVCDLMDIKTLVVMRFDGIGDYLLTRTFFHSLKSSKKYGDYKIILAAKPEYIDLAKKYDKDCFDDYLPFNPFDKLISDEFFNKIKKMSFDILINPIDSKCDPTLQKCVKTINAKKKIGHFGFLAHYQLKEQPQKTKKYLKDYDELVDTGEKPLFVVYAHKLFFEKVICEKIDNINFLQNTSFVEPDLNKKFIVISPFASAKIRVYGKENFAKIIDYITEELKFNVIIIGGNTDYNSSCELVNLCINKERIFNMTGKLSITESLYYIKNAELLIANETGTAHLAQNFSAKTLCICNGSFMNVFQPYPEELSTTMHYVYPDNIEQYLSDNNELGLESSYDINKIPASKVIDSISKIIKEEACFSVL